VIYFEVDDVDATVRELAAQGVEIESGPVDQRWLWREAYLRDPSNNRICLYRAGENRRFPPWRLGESGAG
jgi:predicted enzyme related to lactoylglutathione lyase